MKREQPDIPFCQGMTLRLVAGRRMSWISVSGRGSALERADRRRPSSWSPLMTSAITNVTPVVAFRLRRPTSGRMRPGWVGPGQRGGHEAHASQDQCPQEKFAPGVDLEHEKSSTEGAEEQGQRRGDSCPHIGT